jgi:3D (Asp-Asp-Asp) domain-containing protein
MRLSKVLIIIFFCILLNGTQFPSADPSQGIQKRDFFPDIIRKRFPVSPPAPQAPDLSSEQESAAPDAAVPDAENGINTGVVIDPDYAGGGAENPENVENIENVESLGNEENVENLNGAEAEPVQEVDSLSVPEMREESTDEQCLGKFLITYYWIADESEQRFIGKPKDFTIMDLKGNPLAYVCGEYLRHLNMQGTGRLADGRVVNYADRVDGQIRFTLTKLRYGVGAMGVPLVPFRSIAVDRNLVKLGSTVRIPAAEGIPLPNGKIHDGIFYAVDVGSGVKGHHVDFFLGEARNRKIFEQNGIVSGNRVEVYLPSDM